VRGARLGLERDADRSIAPVARHPDERGLDAGLQSATPSVLVGQRARRPGHVPGRGADASTRSAGIATRPYAKSAGRSSAWLGS